MKFLQAFVFTVVAFNAYALPPDENDKPGELSITKICPYRISLSHDQIDEIKDDALSGDSISAHFLFFNAKLLKELEGIKQRHWLIQANENGNPIATLISSFELLETKSGLNYPKGIAKLKIVAELGLLEAIRYLITIYEGKDGFEKYKSKDLASYWRERYALAGNLFFLKSFVNDNPNGLNEEEMKPWQQSYDFLKNTANGDDINFSKLSTNARWYVILFKENRKYLSELLKEHHGFYSGYKYCNP